MSAPRYPEYKDSGIDWLGPAPSHWTVKRLRHVACLNPGKSQARRLPPETEVTFLPMEAVGDDGSLDRRQTKPLGEVIDGYTYLNERDVAFAKITPCFENGKAALATNLKNELAFATTELTVLRPDTRVVSARYLYRLVTSRPFRELGEASMYGAGGQKRVPDNFARDFAIPLPPPDEQRQIADFLDHETARIDALIEEQQRLIELLLEKKTVTVSRAVTKGVEPSVRMKDSLASYLGSVPHHWNLVPLRYLVTEPLEYGANEPAAEEDPSHPRFIRITDFDDSGNLRSETFRSLPWEVARPYLLNEGDILLARSGATVGKAFIYSGESGPACYAGYLIRARPDRTKVDPSFLSRYLRSAQYWEYINSVTIQATIQNVSAERYGNVLVPVPPLDEQKEILRHLDFAESKEERLLTEARSGISLLRERRAALVSAAVTGKIDVREWEHSRPSADEALSKAAKEESRYV